MSAHLGEIAQRLEDNWDHLTARLHQQAPETAAPSASSQPEVPHMATALSIIHKDLSAAGNAIQHAWPLLQQLATNTLLDELVEAALTASGAGVAAEAFQAATDGLRGAIARKSGTVQQVETAVEAGRQAADGPLIQDAAGNVTTLAEAQAAAARTVQVI